MRMEMQLAMRLGGYQKVKKKMVKKSARETKTAPVTPAENATASASLYICASSPKVFHQGGDLPPAIQPFGGDRMGRCPSPQIVSVPVPAFPSSQPFGIQ